MAIKLQRRRHQPLLQQRRGQAGRIARAGPAAEQPSIGPLAPEQWPRRLLQQQGRQSGVSRADLLELKQGLAPGLGPVSRILKKGDAASLAMQGLKQSRPPVSGSWGRRQGLRRSRDGLQPAIEHQLPPFRPENRHQRTASGQRLGQPGLQRLDATGQQGHPFTQSAQALRQAGVGRLVELIDLGDIEGLLQRAAARGQQHKVVIDQGGRQRQGLLAAQGAAAADQAHAPVAADLQLGAGQAARLPEALQKAAGAVAIAAGKGQHPAGRSGLAVRQQPDSRVGAEPVSQLTVVVETGRREGPIPQPGKGLTGLAAPGGWSNSPRVGQGAIGVAEQIEAEGSVPRHETGGPGQLQPPVLKLQW